MTDQEAKALEAGFGAWCRTTDGTNIDAACRAYHAAMLEGQVVISREDAGLFLSILERRPYSAETLPNGDHPMNVVTRLRAQLGEGE